MSGAMTEQRNRIASIDVFRGLTMFFMLWVNSFWSLSEVPHWLQHAARGEDMLGFSDTIFPAFLFIMGASVPLAIGSRRAKGDSTMKIVWHIFTRAFALVVMGLLTVNSETPFRRRNGAFPRKLCDAHGFGVLSGMERLPAG